MLIQMPILIALYQAIWRSPILRMVISYGCTWVKKIHTTLCRFWPQSYILNFEIINDGSAGRNKQHDE